jgi:hypothetical protein
LLAADRFTRQGKSSEVEDTDAVNQESTPICLKRAVATMMREANVGHVEGFCSVGQIVVALDNEKFGLWIDLS